MSRRSHLSAHVNRDTDDHGGHGDARYEGDAHGCSHQRAELPEDLFLSAPGLLPPKRAAGRAEGREKYWLWRKAGRREGLRRNAELPHLK